jgi:hypothetical protein
MGHSKIIGKYIVISTQVRKRKISNNLTMQLQEEKNKNKPKLVEKQ